MFISSDFRNELSSIHAICFENNILLVAGNDLVEFSVLAHRLHRRGVEVVGEDGLEAHGQRRARGGDREGANARHDVEQLIARLHRLRDQADMLVREAGVPVDLIVGDEEGDAVLLHCRVVVRVARQKLEGQLAELGGDGLGLVDDRADRVLGRAVEDDAGDEVLVRALLGGEIEVDDVADLLEAGRHNDAGRQEAREDLGRGVIGVGEMHIDAGENKEGINSVLVATCLMMMSRSIIIILEFSFCRPVGDVDN